MKWIRLWPDYIINGTTFEELTAEQRGVWFSLLALAGYSPVPGTICIAKGIPYTDEQLAGVLKLPLETLQAAITHLTSSAIHKLIRNADGTLSVANWLKYQTEYERQKGYRRGLQGKVTDKCYSPELPIDTDTDTEVDGEEDQRQPGTAGPKPCPHQDIIDAYHELLPTLPRIRLWQGKRKSYLAARWREEPKRQDLNWWREFFKYVAKSDFLCGRVASTGERKDQPPFMADLEWLVREGNFVKIFEGKYHRRAA